MKLAIAALLVASASAFAPAPSTKATTSLAVSELELGVTEPLGVYDPLGLLETEPEAFERRRAVERKHGRVAMAAVVGCIVHNNHIVFDGYLSPSSNLKFSDVPTGIDGIRAIPTAGLFQILAFFALLSLLGCLLPSTTETTELVGSELTLLTQRRRPASLMLS